MTKQLMYLTYMAEKQSSHPIAKAVVRKLEEVISPFRVEVEGKWSITDSINFDGEGLLCDFESDYRVLCGNEKLLDRYKVKLDSKQKKQIRNLEEQGKTVI